MGLIKNLQFNVSSKDASATVFDTRYSTFKRVSVSRSLDNVCGEFNIILSRPANGKVPFKSGDVMDIQIDNVQVMRGKIYTITLEGDAQNDHIILSGRDITGDLIDSTVPDGSKEYTDGANIFDIAGKILQAKRMSKIIPVINESGGAIKSFTKDEIISCSVGDTVAKFLQKYCRKRQLFLNTSALGGLVFFKAKGRTTGNRIINKFNSRENNVTDYKVKYGMADRFYKYICKTQSSDGWSEGEVDSQAEAKDLSVSTYREKEFELEEGFSGSEECKARAEEEANVRRSRAFEYSVRIVGHKDKSMWGVNQFVTVDDDRAGVHGTFLIKGVEYRIDNTTGATTKLTITNKDAYTAKAAISLRDKQETTTSWYNEGSVGDSIKTLLEDTL